MEKITRILVGIATVKPDRRFLQSLPIFADQVARNLPHVQLDYLWVWNKELVDAQNDFADKALELNYDYLLTIEDDHWNFTCQMLETCLNANTHVAGIPYRSRHFPFEVVPMRFARYENGVKRFTGMNSEKLYQTYHEGDLIGFGFTLIKTEIFRIIDRPFFQLNIDLYKGAGPRATDIAFCDKLASKGIKPIGCFQHRLNHRDITEEKYKEMLVEGVLTQHSMFTTIETISKYKKVAQAFEKNKKENAKLKENI